MYSVCFLGVEQMREEKYMEAVVALQEASAQPSPRALLAHIHMLTGICYAELVGSYYTAKSLQIPSFSSVIFFYENSLKKGFQKEHLF